MPFFKLCHNCQEFFEGPLLDPLCCCPKPECQKKWRNHFLPKFLRERNVLFEYFDVFDIEHNRLCRVCGNPVYKYGRYCEAHRGMKGEPLILLKSNWAYVRDTYIYNLQKKQQLPPPKIKCEKCDLEGTASGGHLNSVQVHHKQPVHTLDETNYMLCWDLLNLEAICLKCHGKTHHHYNLEVKWGKFQRLDSFLKGMTNDG